MKCFYHQGTDAVALCKSCNRALCPACAADVPPGIACKGRCEQEVAAINIILQRGKSGYQKTSFAFRSQSLVLAALGLLFTVFGVIPFVLSGRYSTLVYAVLGPLFLLWSYFSYRSAKQFASTKE